MRTLEEVKEHLGEVGYNRQAMMQIEAFLLGGGMIKPNEELEFVKGKGDFEDFMEWYVYDDECFEEEYEKGDYIHVEDEVDVLCLSDVEDRKFVGTSGKIIHQYELTKDSRFCDEEEIKKVDERLASHGIAYCQVGEELYPIVDEEEKDIPSECIDCLEMQCKQAIENISASLHSGELDKEERNSLIDALSVLVKLGKEYE